MHKSWPTLVHAHIATEDLETLHPGVTGLCFIIKVVILIGLTNALSTVSRSMCAYTRVGHDLCNPTGLLLSTYEF